MIRLSGRHCFRILLFCSHEFEITIFHFILINHVIAFLLHLSCGMKYFQYASKVLFDLVIELLQLIRNRKKNLKENF